MHAHTRTHMLTHAHTRTHTHTHAHTCTHTHTHTHTRMHTHTHTDTHIQIRTHQTNARSEFESQGLWSQLILWCSVMQCDAICCSVLNSVVVYGSFEKEVRALKIFGLI